MINENKIYNILENAKSPSAGDVRAVLEKAKKAKGLSLQDTAVLINTKDKALEEKIFKLASRLKKEIYGERLVFFAPLYVSDFCVNDCEYCNFHARNKVLKRRRLALKEVAIQAERIINMGHKRILVEFGEDMANCGIDYIVEVINKIYSARAKKGNIRRINVNIAAATTQDYRKLKKANIGTYQLFQETYHCDTYKKLHRGPKQDYNRQLTAHIKAFRAGIDDYGMGVLFGLYDWRFELLALLWHAQYLEEKLGVGPHTISVPRFRPAPTVSYKPQYPVSDSDFLKIIAILRLAVPYTGLILSTRESPRIRRQAFLIGISQASACSVTSVGGYDNKNRQKPQFVIADRRGLDEVISGILKDKLLPSFCTACYRKGRTGQGFMELSKAAHIHNFCRPNGLLTFAEYLEDFSGPGVYKKGYRLINYYLNKIKDVSLRKKTQYMLKMVKKGQRDLYF